MPAWRMALTAGGATAFLLGLALLMWQVRSLLRHLSERIVADLPFGAGAEFRVAAPGRYALAIDRPRLLGWNQPTGSVLADKLTGRDRYRYVLTEAACGAGFEAEKTLVPFTTTKMTRIRYDVARFEIPRAGLWRLAVDGFDAGPDDAGMRWLVMRAGHPLGLVGRILGLIAGGALAIAGLVTGILALGG